MFLVGAATAAVAGILALRRLGADPADTSSRERGVRRVLVGGLGVVLVASAVLTATGGATVPPEQRAGAIEILADDFAFAPELVQQAAGGAVVVVNDDIFHHTFTIDALGIDVSLLPGDEALVEIPADATGQVHQFVCTPHVFDGDGMVGTLEITG